MAPCDLDVDPDGTYRISGTDVLKSKPFELPSNARAVTVSVDAKTKQDKVWAWVFTAGGGFVFVDGVSLYLMGVITSKVEDDNAAQGMETTNAGGTLQVLGLVAMGVGMVSGIVGLVKLSDLETTVEVEETGGGSRRDRASLGRGIFLDPSGVRF